MRSRTRRPGALVGGLAVTVLTLAACGDGESAQQGGADGGSLRVAASTNVWGSVVRAVGGDEVEVVALIDDPSADPHSYEGTPRDAAEVQDADLVVLNGGGYDEFMTRILDSVGSDKPTVNAAELLGLDDDHGTDDESPDDDSATGPGGEPVPAPPDDETEGAADDEHADEDGHADEDDGHGHDGHEHGDGNEHVWYDVATVGAVAEAVAHELGELDPDGAETYTANAEAFHNEIDELGSHIDAVGTELDGEAHILSTEPLGQYLFARAGLHDLTPPDFLRAVDAETDPPAAAIAEINEAVDGGGIDALVFNPQTETAVTSQVRERAEAAGIPVVEFTETLPEGEQDYVAWMTGQVDALSTALTP
ncbi:MULTISPECIES: metal ABC transporter solute-binding protein, Zn/Mn family [Actinoalloteichus]|uniref:ABC-type metal ion transport system, periplasmic component/surface adhesin n=1 Tax=Actinoalloteichus fjordicus TaxID=1612552 RepID=A0AAC9PQ16_9PSEU|nr:MULTISPECIES: zinc ABC transporter substrate-binding protein [Actinoalloteichus]APU12441.1 ABC-type metal ion transport system, periplasmic component/surface adhesin [Actinoalloteichus fjordicus]APU18394.1 ABC-type metal ion transport system, periplasmic component/surface adhesin [Actinoalloteichus sp. GBA129-24]